MDATIWGILCYLAGVVVGNVWPFFTNKPTKKHHNSPKTLQKGETWR